MHVCTLMVRWGLPVLLLGLVTSCKAYFGDSSGQSSFSPNSPPGPFNDAGPGTKLDPPNVSSVSPLSGSALGGTSITIIGTGFRQGARVLLGSDSCLSITIVSSGQISCTTPPHAAGVVNVSVTNPDNQSGSSTNAFTFQGAPVITSLVPSSGSPAGGTQVVINGEGFRGGAIVSLGADACASMTVDSATQITCVTPAHAAGPVAVKVTNPDSQQGTSPTPFTFASEISSWAFVDGGNATGLNKLTNKYVERPKLVSFNARLYAIWREYNASNILQVRVAVKSGAQTWSFVDGDGPSGLNKSSSQHAFYPDLASSNGKLYAIWSENLNNAQVRVAEYNGLDSAPVWSFVDGNSSTNGINHDSSKSAFNTTLITFNSQLYASWSETNGTSNQIRVARYNGVGASPLWSFVDGNGVNGLNKTSSNAGTEPRFAIFNSQLYVTWEETPNVGQLYQVRVAVFNGASSSPPWSFVDGNGQVGLNKDSGKDAKHPHLIPLGSKLYATWQEVKSGNDEQVRVAAYNGSQWTFVDGGGSNGINHNTSTRGLVPSGAAFNSKLYIAWSELLGSFFQTRVAVYDPSAAAPAWTFVDGNGTTGINRNSSAEALYPVLCVHDSQLYAAWEEKAAGISQVRAAVGQ